MTVRLLALILAAIGILAAAVIYAGASPMVAVTTLVKGSLGDLGVFSGTLQETSPLLIAGLAVFLALRAGLFNIGVEGQLLVGAMASAAVALRVPGTAGLILGVIGGIVAGALWALPAGLIRAYRYGHEVITTIMLNNIARFMTTAMVAGPLRDMTQETATTAIIPAEVGAVVSRPPLSISWALVLGAALVVIAGLWLRRTVAGYEMEAVGANPIAAMFAGVRPSRVMVGAMLASGGVAGFGGALQVFAYEHRFYGDFSAGYGFDGLGIALLAGANPLAIVPSALLFGVLAKGGVALGIEQIPKGITTVIIGLVILVASAIRYREVKKVA